MTAPGWAMKYHLHVVAPRANDVVIGIGAWLFDQVRSGWTISVMLSEPVGPTGLRVLGTEATAIDPMSWACKDSAHVIATEIELYNSDAALRRHVDRASRDSRKEVLLWGSTTHARWPQASLAVRYEPSRAACIFKTHAVTAAGLSPGSVATEETFHSLSRHDSARRPTTINAIDDATGEPTDPRRLHDLALTN